MQKMRLKGFAAEGKRSQGRKDYEGVKMTEPATLVKEFLAVFGSTAIPLDAYMPKEQAELLESAASSVGAVITAVYPSGKHRSEEYREALAKKLGEILQEAPITQAFKDYLIVEFRRSYDSGIAHSAVRWMGFNVANGRYGIFDSEQAPVIEASFIEDLPRTIRAIEAMVGSTDENAIYYRGVLERWQREFENRQKKS